MKLTRRQLRKIISEAVKYVTVPNEEDEYFKDLRASQTQKEREAVQKVFKADPGMGLELGAVVPIEDETTERVFPLSYDHLGFKSITDKSIWLHRGHIEPADINTVINVVVKEFSRILKKPITANNLFYSDPTNFAPWDPSATPKEKIIRKKKFNKWWDMYAGFQYALTNPGKLKTINVPVTTYNPIKQENFKDAVWISSYCCVDSESGMQNVKDVISQFEGMHVIFLESAGINAIVIHVP